MKFILDVTAEEIEKQYDEIIDWTYKTDMIDRFMLESLSDLVQLGGSDLLIYKEDGTKIGGKLTGVNVLYLELDELLRIPLDEVVSIMPLNNDKNFNNKQK